MSLRRPLAFAITSFCVIQGGVLACVSDTSGTGKANDASVSGSDGASGGSDGSSGGSDSAPSVDASDGATKCTPPPSELGSLCPHNGISHCPASETCCVSVVGGDTLAWQCHEGVATTEAEKLAFCVKEKGALWSCDKPQDCTSGGARCCVAPLFQIASERTCPIKISLAAEGDGGGPPPDGRVTRCGQQACEGATACAVDGDCDKATEECVRVELQGKDKAYPKEIGVCLKKE